MSNPFIDSHFNDYKKFDGENYVNWKFKLLTVLEAYNMWLVVSGDEVKPS